MQKRHVCRHMRSGHDKGISVYSHGKNYVIYNCEPIRRAIRKEDNKYGGRSVETRVHAYEKQFRLGLQKGMEDFPLFLRAGLIMFQ